MLERTPGTGVRRRRPIYTSVPIAPLVEQDGFLRYHADSASQRALRQIPNVVPVELDSSFSHIVESIEQSKQC